MCYFVTVGARTSAQLLAEHFERESELEIDVCRLPAGDTSVFPEGDEVCLVTRYGCSCDLVGKSARTKNVAAAFERSVAQIARRFGGMRIVIRRHRDLGRRPAGAVRLTAAEMLGRRDAFIEDVLLDITGDETGTPSACH